MSLKTLEKLIDSGVKLTPMMQQYFNIKKENPDILLLFRMGDFYELFFDDAVEASKILNIALTHRGKIGDYPVPMAGIPHHAANTYIDRITSKGLKAAICDQIEDPKDAIGIVKRAVTQIVSPCIPYDLEKSDAREGRFLTSAVLLNKKFYLASLDFTNGDFLGQVFTSEEGMLERLRLLSSKEFLSFMGQWDSYPAIKTFLNESGTLVTYLSEEYFDSTYTKLYTQKTIPYFERDNVISSNSEILSAVGALAYYLSSTQAEGNFCHIKPFRILNQNDSMSVSLATLIGLEIIPREKNNYNKSLLGHFDKTKSSMGARRLREIFTTPSCDLIEIKRRQEIVEKLLPEMELVKELRLALDDVRDIERILAKVATKKANAGDLLNLSRTISCYKNICALIAPTLGKQIKPLENSLLTRLQELAAKIAITINDEIGASLDKGNLIRPGFHKERDRLASMKNDTSEELLKFESALREETGITNLKVKSNNVSGFFIEVSKSHLTKIPSYFVRRQTLVNAERFSTERLDQFEKEVVTAKFKLEKLERELFVNLIDNVSNLSRDIIELAGELALIDVFQSFTWTTLQEGLVKPTFLPNKKIFEVVGGFHPLIKSLIRDHFVSHDLHLDNAKYFGLITGPNMAGKTTVMREMAIIQLLAQIGHFVPAKKATLGVCDFLFSRLGASDDIQRGQSTFMVEMAETAEIIRHSTEKSLIILDEVGRGTSTYDGLSIAWSLVEHLIHTTKALTLFATHYHELIELVNSLPGGKNLTVETVSTKGDVHFLYRLIEQGASQSYGIYVAKLAGLPYSILKRSEEILHKLERHDNYSKVQDSNEEFQPSFITPEIEPREYPPQALQQLEMVLRDVDLNTTTPFDALLKLKELKDHLN